MLLEHGGPGISSACVAAGAPPHFHAAGAAAACARASWFGGAMADWAVMFAAMMLTLQLAQLSYVTMRSFAARRTRAALEYLVGYALVWLAAGVASLFVIESLHTAPPGAVSAATLLLAATWQDTPWKRLALRGCHRAPNLSAFGWRAERDCLAFGLRSGGLCLLSCGPMMLALAVGGHGLTAMLTVSMVIVAERFERRPQIRASQLLLLMLAGLALFDG